MWYLNAFSFSLQASFEIREDANPQSRKRHLTRFQENPQANWGPKARAKAGCVVFSHRETIKISSWLKSIDFCFVFSGGISSELEDKRKQFQGKRKHVPDSSQLKDFPCKKFRKVRLDYHMMEEHYVPKFTPYETIKNLIEQSCCVF